MSHRVFDLAARTRTRAAVLLCTGIALAFANNATSQCPYSTGSGTARTWGLNRETFAIEVIPTRDIEVTGFSLGTRVVFGASATIPTALHVPDYPGGPPRVTPERFGTMTIQNTFAGYRTTFSEPMDVRSGEHFFLVFSNTTSGMQTPWWVPSPTNPLYTHHQRSLSGGEWGVPWTIYSWIWQVQCNLTGPPTVDFSGTPRAGQAPLTVAFVDRSGRDPTSWSWEFGDGGQSNQQNLAHTYDDPGLFDVRLTATNHFGSASRTKTDYVLVREPTPSVGGVRTHRKISETRGGFTGNLDREDSFGRSLALLGDLDGDGVDDLAVGAATDDDGGENTGATWILFLNGDGTVKAHQKISDTQGGFTGTLSDGCRFGQSLAALEDFDGDGVPDLAVSALMDDDGGTNRGAVWILFLNADGTVKSHQKISSTRGGFTGTLSDNDRLGASLASLGDLDRDGVRDLAVGASRHDDGGTDRGAVWILFLNTDGTVDAHQKISDTEGGFTGVLNDDDRFGREVSFLGDHNGDGSPALAVGVPLDDDGGTDRGAVWILFLDADGTVRSHQKISSTQGSFVGPLRNEDHFGCVRSIGDLDGDGLGDLAVGAAGDDDGGTNHGAVWILFLDGDATVKAHQKISSLRGGFTGVLDDDDWFGRATVPLGDLDGDGITELAVSATRDDDGGTDRGAVWVLYTTGRDGPWQGLGEALAGTHGLPNLIGVGTMRANEPFALYVSNALANRPAALAIGASRIDLPFLGGLFVPTPHLVGETLIDAGGGAHVTLIRPTGVPVGATFYFQTWLLDPGGAQGAAATNAVAGTAR